MAPGPGKRKRGSYGGDDGSRPAPYHPSNLGMAQYSYGGPPHGGYHDDRGRGSRRGGRAGRGGRGGPRGPDSANGAPYNQRRGSLSNQQNSRPQSRQSQTQTQPEPSAPQEQPALSLPVVEPAPPPGPVDTYAVAAAMKFPPLDEPIAPYTYDYISDEIAQTWQDGGRASLLEKVTQMRQDSQDDELNIVYAELLRAGLDGKVPPADIGALVKDILAVEIDSEEMDEGVFPADHVSDFLDMASMLHEKDGENPRLGAMLFASEISHDKMRQELDSELLVTLELVRPTFKKSFIRHQTNVLYRQSNYNLLREETEGYSKLMTELFTTSANEMPSAEVVKATFERVRSMIGTFDLDVGRVLDVSLDVFAAVLVREYRFFVKFLRCSSWWPSESKAGVRTPELPSWALPDADGLEPLSHDDKSALEAARYARDRRFWSFAGDLTAQGKGISAFFHLRNLQTSFSPSTALDIDDTDSSGWKKLTGVEPPVGNKVAAQILGFKLRYYSSQARGPQDEIPNNLIHLAALLIKIGFISLRDLYPHLWPHDDEMEKIQKQKEEEHNLRKQAARPGGGQNALTRAGALSDDAAPPPLRTREVEPRTAAKTEAATETTDTKSEDELPEPKDTKIALLKALLAIGAVPEALFMLGRFPWLLRLIHDLPDYIHRILSHSISGLYDPVKPLQVVPELQEPATVADPDQSGVSRGDLRRLKQPAPKSLRWANLDKEMTDEGVQYRFYWEDWHDNIPVCQSVDDLFTLCDSFLNLSGVKIGQDPGLLMKLYRIGIHSLSTDKSAENKQRWVDLCKKLLVPALSLTGHNSPVVNECWELLKLFSQRTRYAIYAEWFLGPTSRMVDIAEAFAITKAETNDVLKRISKTNIRPMARALAKTATSSPGVVFQAAIQQMENYTNLIEVVVECARYFTALGYDVLVWSTLQSLGRARNRQSADGMFASKWLIALSSFFGKVYLRYSLMNLNPTLQYLANQLYLGNANDLKVLEELLLNMGGIRSNITLNDAQIVAMAGGPLLQKEVREQLQDKRHESRPPARRLMRALIDTKLVGAFVISIAQERQTQYFKLGESDAPLKLLGNAFDDMHQTFYQYLEFLREFLPNDKFDEFVPALGMLIRDYRVEPPIAFLICRASIVSKMDDWDRSQVENKNKASQQLPATSTDVEMTDNSSANPDVEMTETENAAEQSAKHEAATASSLGWHPVLKQIMDESSSVFDPLSLEIVGQLFYMTFWQLSHGDLYVPQESYSAEEARINQRLRAINQDRSDQTIAGSRRRQADRATLNQLKDQLASEHKDQVSAYSRFTRSRIQKEKEHWFAHTWGKHDALNTALLEECFLPRIVLSQVDAYYCFRMLKLLHSNGAKNFRTMGFLDQFFNQKRLAALFFMCTLKEAENLAVFINEILKDLGKWHARKETYESEALGARKDLPGFCKKLGEDKASFVFLDYEEEFKRLLFKWHGQLANAIRTCLEAGEYMHIRNAINILSGINGVFPVVDIQARKLVETVTALVKTESREDLKLAAQSLLGALSRRERNNEWVSLASFYPVKNTGVVAQGTTTSTNAAVVGKFMNAAASEFKPTRLNGAKTLADYEDGEINSPTVAEAPRNGSNKAGANADQLPSAAAHTTLSAVTATGKAATPSETAASNKADGPTISSLSRNDSRSEGRPSPVPGSRGDTGGRLTNGASRPPQPLPVRPEGTTLVGRRGERGYRGDDRSIRDARPRDDREAAYYDQSRAPRPLDSRSRPSDRVHERGLERPPVPERDRSDSVRRENPPARHDGPDERPPRPSARTERPERPERSARDGRHHPRDLPRDEAARDRPAAELAMPPPAPAVNPDRARLIEADQSAAAPKDRDARDGSRSSSQRGSRANSPARRDERSHRSSHRDERPYPPETRLDRPHPDDRRAAGIRADPFVGHDDRARHSRGAAPPVDIHSSRHRDYGPPQTESQYGRLNGPDTPTGPRGSAPAAATRPSRVPSGPAAPSHPTNADRPIERAAPSGPASSRGPPRLSTASQSRPGNGSAPSTPIGETPGTGMHPERARQFQTSGPSGQTASSPSIAPRGPAADAPSGPIRQPPSAPQSGPSTPVFDRPRSDKRFANLNNTLQQVGGPISGPAGRPEQGTSIRGRGGRNPPQSPLGPGPTPPSGPSGPGRHDAGPTHGEPTQQPRPDLFSNHEGSGRRGPPDSNDPRQRGSRRSVSPPRRGLPPGGPEENMRPPPRRMESRENMRSSREGPPPGGPMPPVADRDRRGPPRDDFGPGHASGRRGGDRRDSRNVSWGGERPGGDRRADGLVAPEGPGSGQKRPRAAEHDDYRSDNKRQHRKPR